MGRETHGEPSDAESVNIGHCERRTAWAKARKAGMRAARGLAHSQSGLGLNGEPALSRRWG